MGNSKCKASHGSGESGKKQQGISVEMKVTFLKKIVVQNYERSMLV